MIPQENCDSKYSLLTLEVKAVTSSGHKVGVMTLLKNRAIQAKIIGTQERNNIYVQRLHAQFSSSANLNSESKYAKAPVSIQ